MSYHDDMNRFFLSACFLLGNLPVLAIVFEDMADIRPCISGIHPADGDLLLEKQHHHRCQCWPRLVSAKS